MFVQDLLRLVAFGTVFHGVYDVIGFAVFESFRVAGFWRFGANVALLASVNPTGFGEYVVESRALVCLCAARLTVPRRRLPKQNFLWDA